MDIINGHNLRVYIGGVAVAKATECSYSLSTDMREIAHKDTAGASGGFKEVRPGQKSGEMSTNALYAEGESFETLFAAWDAGTELTVKFSDEVTGHFATSSAAYITGLEKTAADNENVSYSASFVLSGAITRAANS